MHPVAAVKTLRGHDATAGSEGSRPRRHLASLSGPDVTFGQSTPCLPAGASGPIRSVIERLQELLSALVGAG